MSELKEKKKMKVMSLYEYTPKQFEPDPNPQNSLLFYPKKPKKKPLNQMELKARSEEDIENICFSAT